MPTPLIQQLLDTASEQEAVRDQAASALEDQGPPAAEEAPAIAALLTCPHADVVYWAATLLGRLEAQAEPFSADLAKVLDSAAELHARERAAWALGMIGPPARDAALLALDKAAASKEPRLARVASQAAARIRQ